MSALKQSSAKKEHKKKASFKRGLFYQWQLTTFDFQLVKELSTKTSFLPALVEVLFTRGKQTSEQITDFVFSKNIDFSKIHCMKDASKAVDRILKAIENKEKILVFGDYDVDGMTSVSIFLLAMIPLGANVQYFLPNRVVHGYGISGQAVRAAAKKGFSLIITVDNGTCAQEAAETARELSLDLIVTDHHQPKETLPEVFALVNPHQKDCNYPFKEFCGAGVIFKIVSIIYQKLARELPVKVLELFTMGTIADVVALEDENRFWVKKGLAQLCTQMSFSFAQLASNGGIDINKGFWSAQDIAFSIAPQLNALGRLSDPTSAVRFLISDDQQEVATLAQELKAINLARKEVDRAMFAEVNQKIKSGAIDINKTHVIVDASTNWPAGVVGLVAGRLMQTFARPVFLFHITSDGMAKGSCRSIAEINILEALEQAKHLLTTFGGHSCAAGLALKADNLPVFSQIINRYVAARLDISSLEPKIVVDGTLNLSDLNQVFFKQMQLLEPFGQKNPFPVFQISNISILGEPTLVNEKHVRFTICQGDWSKQIIFFNRPELFDFLKKELLETTEPTPQLLAKKFSLLAKPDFQMFQGKLQIKLIGIDIALD